MNAHRLLVGAAACAIVAGPVAADELRLAQTDENVIIITPDDRDGERVVSPDDVEVEVEGIDRDVDVEDPNAIVGAEPGEFGEAPTVDPESLVELDDDFVVPGLNVPVYALDDYDLEDRNGNDLGEVEEVLGPDENTATAVAIEFDGPGWFFNDADVTRVVDISLLTIVDDKLILDVEEENVRAFPVYQD